MSYLVITLQTQVFDLKMIPVSCCTNLIDNLLHELNIIDLIMIYLNPNFIQNSVFYLL